MKSGPRYWDGDRGTVFGICKVLSVRRECLCSSRRHFSILPGICVIVSSLLTSSKYIQSSILLIFTLVL